MYAIETQLHWNTDSDVISNMPKGEGLPIQEENEITYVERILSEQRITFLGSPLVGRTKIKTVQDVAFLFKNLENAASENVFAVLHKPDGTYSVLYLSTGTSSQSFIDIKQVAAAVNELGASAVTLVHNHPSGQIMPSSQDIKVHAALVEILNIKVKPSVIINLDSGKFGVFTHTDKGREIDKKEQASNFEIAKVYQFDRLKLHKTRTENYVIKKPEDVAEFLSIHKRGTVDKIHAIVLDAQGRINRYVLLPINMNRKELITKLVEEAGKYGEQIILASNGLISIPDLKVISRTLSKTNVTLLDYLTVKQDKGVINNYVSALDEGLLCNDFSTQCIVHEKPITLFSKYPSIIGSVKLSIKQRKALAGGETIKIAGMTDKFGQEFTADVRWNAVKNKPEYNNAKLTKEARKKADIIQKKCPIPKNITSGKMLK
jgi:DNA repair protein RadC